MADTKEIQSTKDYIIEEAFISRGKAAQLIDIKNSIDNVEIYESLDKPYLTGRLFFRDDFGFFDNIRFSGTERLELTLRHPKNTSDFIFKQFILTSAADSEKVNEFAEMFVFEFMEEIAFLNQNMILSKSYTGNPVEIAKKIIADSLGVIVENVSDEPFQKRMKVVVPMMHPLQAAQWVLKRATTEEGLPYYMYSSLNDRTLIIKSMKDMLLEPTWNVRPFRYSRSYVQGIENPHDEKLLYNVDKFRSGDNESTINFVNAGTITSHYKIFDSTTGRHETFKFDLKSHLARLSRDQIIPRDQLSAFEESFQYEAPVSNATLAEHTSKAITRVIYNNTYGTEYRNYYEASNAGELNLDAAAMAYRHIIFKNSAEFTLNGLFFLTGANFTLGRNIDFIYPKNDGDIADKPQISNEDLIDKKRSGRYLIYNASHLFSDGQHTVACHGAKISNAKD
jgi:hypothetical protein